MFHNVYERSFYRFFPHGLPGVLRTTALVFLVLMPAFAPVRAQKIPAGKVSSAQLVAKPHEVPGFVIIKFRNQSSLRSASGQLASALSAVAAQSVATAPRVFPNHTPGKFAVQAVVDTFGLDRVLLLPLKEGVTPESAVLALEGFREIEYVEPNYIYHIEMPVVPDSIRHPNDSLFSQQWNLQDIDVPAAWVITEGDSTIRIGWVDTGVDWTHPELVNQFGINKPEDINHNGLFDPWPNTLRAKDARGDSVYGDLDGIDQDDNGYSDDVIGYNFVDEAALNYGTSQGRGPIPVDQNGHGTLIAGVLAAQKNNRIGIAGIAPKCKLVSLRAFDYSGNGEDDDIAAAIVYAADNNVKILNLSFGDVVPSLLQRDAIRYATAKGVLIFASSGDNYTDTRHYPSDFDECVSVGGTGAPPYDGLVWNQAGHGEQMDLVAPAANILSLSAGDSGYTSDYSGTSFSAPQVAATAALLWSERPTLSPIEVRSIIESTTKDVQFPGYDHLTANGIVDAAAALNYRGSAAIKITSPHTDDGFQVGDTIPIVGYAVSALFQHYSISYASGINPDNANGNDQSVWIPIVQRDSQVENSLLAKWSTSGLAPGYYTIRLAVQSSDLRSTEERMIVSLANGVPHFASFVVDTAYLNFSRTLQVLPTTDLPTTCSVYYRPRGSQGWSLVTDDRYVHAHQIVLGESVAPKGVALDILCVVRDLEGDSASISSIATIPNDAVPQNGFSQKSYTLPPCFALDSVFSTSSGDQVVMSVYPAGSNGGPLVIYQFDSQRNKFRMVDSAAIEGVPAAIGNTRGDANAELLTQSLGGLVLYAQNAGGSLLSQKLYTSNVLTASGLVDVEGTGKEAIIAIKQDTLKVQGGVIYVDSLAAFEWNGSAYAHVGTFNDTTQLGTTEGSKNYDYPLVASADFFGDGKQEVVAMDADADVVAYRRDGTAPTGFRPFFVDENNADEEQGMLTTGDFDGDGRPDIAFAFYRSPYANAQYNEFDPNFWTLKVFLNRGNGTFELNTISNFLPIRNPDEPFPPQYTSSLHAIPSVTGGGKTMLALSIFPNFYLLEFDSVSKSVKPIWNYPISITGFGALAHDFDHNGKTEFGFIAGDSVRFFEMDSGYASRTASPGGLTVIPRDTNRVDLFWGAVEGAQYYNVLRADTGAATYQLLDTSLTTRYVDTTVQNHALYFYSVNAVDSAMQIPASLTAPAVECYVHPTPRIDSVSATTSALFLHTSQPLSSRALSSGVVVVDDSLAATSVADASDSAVIATMGGKLGAGSHGVKVRTWELRDFWNSPFDTSVSIPFSVSESPTPGRFYILNWTFVGSQLIHVVFNQIPADDALEPGHYSLTPYGSIAEVDRDPSNSMALNIHLSSSGQIAPIGTAFVLCVTGIHDTLGDPIEGTEGNCAGETLAAPNLSQIMVYPNPAKRSDAIMTFGGLTATATIDIYSKSMVRLRTISTIAKNGGVSWDMKDDKGRDLPTGVYIYTVEGKDDNGNTVASNQAKFVIIGDE